MNILLDALPETVTISGRAVPIEADFRTGILFELLIQDDEATDIQKMTAALDLYFPGGLPEDTDVAEAFRAIAWFYLCGKEAAGQEDEAGHRSPADPVYSFEHDADYIYAAFRQQYGVDLTNVEHLHWWAFRAMFRGLTGDCEFVKIMGYRTAKIHSGMGKQEREFLRKMKKVHDLPVSERRQKEQDALISALINGGDVDGVLGYSKEERG